MTIAFQAEDRGGGSVGIVVEATDGYDLKAAQAQIIAEVRLTEAVEMLTMAVRDLRRTIERC